MEIIAGTTLKQLQPRVWDPESPFHLSDLRAVMFSFTDFHRSKSLRERAMKDGLHKTLGVPGRIRIYIDNGAFANILAGNKLPERDYQEFVSRSKPDWYPVPADFIPLPSMTRAEQESCFEKTMRRNRNFSFDGFVPVIHAGGKLEKYIKAIQAHEELNRKNVLALGGLVPQFFQTHGTGPKTTAIDSILKVRQSFNGKIHAFGIGGTATLHIACVLGLDSVDSSGWRNRAARGIIQLPGRGERIIAQLGNWKGKEPDRKELALLRNCQCPGCGQAGIRGLKENGTIGFARRATHNLYVLLEELREIEGRLKDGSYQDWYSTHVFNKMFLRLIDYALEKKNGISNSI